MESFQDEMAALRREANASILPVTNTIVDIEQFKRDSPGVVDAICDDIKRKIKEEAKRNQIFYNTIDTGFLFRKTKQIEPHYRVSWTLYVKFDRNVGFKYGDMTLYVDHDVYVDEIACKGLYIKNSEFAIKIMEAVVQQLEKDDIFLGERKYTNYVLRTEKWRSELDKYFDRKNSEGLGFQQNKDNPADIYCQFSYFLD